MRQLVHRIWPPLVVALLVGIIVWWVSTPRPPLVVDGSFGGFTPDGRLFEHFRAGEYLPLCEVLDSKTGKVVAEFQFPQRRLVSRFLSDGTLLAKTGVRENAAQDFVAYRFDPKTQVTSELWRAFYPAARVSFSEDGRVAVAMVGENFHEEKYEVWDLQKGAVRLTIPSPFRFKRMSFLSLSDDGRYAAAFEQSMRGGDDTKPYGIWLWDLESGKLRDYLELPQDVSGTLRQPMRSGWLEMVTLRRETTPRGVHITGNPVSTFFDLNAHKPFARGYVGLAIEPEQRLLLVANATRDKLHVETLDGVVVSPAIPVAGYLVSAAFVPRSGLVAIRSEAVGNAPQSYQYFARKLGLPLAPNTYWGEASLVDWRTGKVVLSCPNRVNPYARPRPQGALPGIGDGVPRVIMARNGSQVAFTCQVEGGWQTEIWPMPPPERSWLLIIGLAIAAACVTVGVSYDARPLTT